MNISSFDGSVFTVKTIPLRDENCTVCFDSHSVKPLLEMPCKYLIHLHCLKLWLDQRLKYRLVEICPNCRKELQGLAKKLGKIEELQSRYENQYSLDIAEKAINEWDKENIGYEALIHFVELCIQSRKLSDESQGVDILKKRIDDISIEGIVKGEIPIRNQPAMIRFEVARNWLKLCQQGSEAFTQKSSENKGEVMGYIKNNLQYGRECGFDQAVNELESELNKLLIEGIVKGEIPIRNQSAMIRFEVARSWLKLCQQGSEAFTQRSSENKVALMDYIEGNLQFGRECGFDQAVNELESELNKLLIEGIVKGEIPIRNQPAMIRFEVARNWLKLCQQGSEAFTQKSSENKGEVMGYIKNNLQYGRECGFDQAVNELESELNKLLIEGIVKGEIPIRNQSAMIRFEVARSWLKLCQQGSEAFTQRSSENKVALMDYIEGNLHYGRECGFDHQTQELLAQLNILKTNMQLTSGSKGLL